MTAKWLYGNSWERFPIRVDETWVEMGSQSTVAVCDLFDELPEFMLQADMIYTDPPWNTGNIKSFYTKAGVDTDTNFSQFVSVFFDRVAQINARVCYLEIGKQNLDLFKKELERLYPSVQSWAVTYYKKHASFLLRGASEEITFDFAGLDDMETPRMAMENEDFTCVADLCMGRGLTATSAYKLNKRFVGTELNKRRLAVTIERVAKLGGIWNNGLSLGA